MDRQQRDAAMEAYRERPQQAGVYAITCTITGQEWIGSAPDVRTIQNRLWFGLRLGGGGRVTGAGMTALQAAWQQHGEAAFTFTVLETRDADDPEPDPRRLRQWLTARAAEWQGRRGGLEL